MTNLNKILEQTKKEFDEKFIYWVILGSTLNDGSERRWRYEKQLPQEILDFITQSQLAVIEEIKIICEQSMMNRDTGDGYSCGYDEALQNIIHDLTLHVCCDGECNHDDCCGKVEKNCPNYDLTSMDI